MVTMERYGNIKGKAFFLLMFLWFIWFMNFSVRTVFAPIMPLIEDEFLISHAKASSLYVFTSLGYGISLFFSGMLSGLFGYKRSIIASLLVSAAVFFILPSIKAFSLVSLSTFVLGLSTGVYLPSIIPLITEYYNEKVWGRAIAIHDTAASISIFSIPFIALFFLRFLQWRQIFYVFGIVFIISIVVFAITIQEIKIQTKTGNILGDLVKSKTLWLMGAIWIFAAGANLGVYFIIPLYLTKELSLDIGYANKIFGISRLGGVFVAIMSGFIIDRFSLKKTMFFVVSVAGVFTMLLACKDIRFLEVFLFLQASVMGGFFPVGLVSISRAFNREQRGMATGLIVTLGVIFGLGIIPYFLGLSGDLVSFRLGMFVLGVLMVLVSGLTFFLKELK